MAISIDWGNKIINVPQSYLTLITGTLYELDTAQFRLDLKNLEDDPEGMPFPDTHRHNTQVTVAGVTYARVIEIINGYQIKFEDGQYSVRLVGSNNNFFDVENGILYQNQVQVIPGNAAGLIVVETGVSGLTQDESDALLAIESDQATITAAIGTINTAINAIQIDLSSLSDVQDSLLALLRRALGLMQENYEMVQCQYADYQGQKLLTYARVRLYNTDDKQQWNYGNLIAQYDVNSSWNGQELVTYRVNRITVTTTTTTTTTS